VLHAADVPEVRVLGTDAGIVEPGRDRVRVRDLTVVVREDRRPRAVEHARAPAPERRGAGRLDADDAHLLVLEEAVEEADRVRAAADARHDRLGEPPLGRENLLARLVPDDALQVAHDLRIRRRAYARADEVMRRLDVRDPVADRLARRLLQRLRAEVDRAHLRAEQAHALDVGLLPAHVL